MERKYGWRHGAASRVAFAFAVKTDVALDVAIAPPGALTRVAKAINRRPKRLFGVFKTENEYIGRVDDVGFEVWERRQRAVHVRGEVKARRGGSRIELTFFFPRHTRVLIVAFFLLYAAGMVGIGLGADEGLTLERLVFAVGGAVVIALIFAVAAWRQRVDLRTFIERLFGDVPRV